MSRDFFINGESLVYVKGNVASAIANLSELGLASEQIRVTPEFAHEDINVNAWGRQPADVQFMLASVNINMSLIHFDRAVLNVCLMESMGGAPAIGAMPRAGTRLGAGFARFLGSNRYIGLNIASPVAGIPWRFFFAYMTGPPVEFPLGNEKSIVNVNWRAIPYTVDPWNQGAGAGGAYIWDHTLDV